MAVFTVMKSASLDPPGKSSGEVWATPGVTPDASSAMAAPTPVLAAIATPVGQVALSAPGYLGSRKEIENELDSILAAARCFSVKPSDVVMMECSAYLARLTELRVLLQRVEHGSREYARVRTTQVQPIADMIELQYKMASRLVEVARQDIELSRG